MCSNCGPQSVVSGFPGGLVEMQNLRPHFRITKSESFGMEPRNQYFKKLSKLCSCTLKLIDTHFYNTFGQIFIGVGAVLSGSKWKSFMGTQTMLSAVTIPNKKKKSYLAFGNN